MPNLLVELIKLRKKTQIVFEEGAQVSHAVTQHGQTLNTHAKGQATVLIGVNTDIAQHIGMNHAATEHFQPAIIPHDIDFS